jgi:predicted regulator of Ras-like GTPase activity (Roadblock/LC7/MglB family)
MDAARALADLTEISSQIREAALVGPDGQLVAGSERVARAARELLEAAEGVRPGGGLIQAEASTAAGSLFVVRDGDRVVAATTGPEPTVGLVFYDLKAALRSADEDGAGEQEPAKPRRTRRKKEEGDGEA